MTKKATWPNQNGHITSPKRPQEKTLTKMATEEHCGLVLLKICKLKPKLPSFRSAWLCCTSLGFDSAFVPAQSLQRSIFQLLDAHSFSTQLNKWPHFNLTITFIRGTAFFLTQFTTWQRCQQCTVIALILGLHKRTVTTMHKYNGLFFTFSIWLFLVPGVVAILVCPYGHFGLSTWPFWSWPFSGPWPFWTRSICNKLTRKPKTIFTCVPLCRRPSWLHDVGTAKKYSQFELITLNYALNYWSLAAEDRSTHILLLQCDDDNGFYFLHHLKKNN